MADNKISYEDINGFIALLRQSGFDSWADIFKSDIEDNMMSLEIFMAMRYHLKQLLKEKTTNRIKDHGAHLFDAISKSLNLP